LVDLGVTDLGENRDQEAAPKAAQLGELLTGTGKRARWHFVGQLQRNKCRSVVRYADVVQSVDSVRLAHALANASRAAIDAGERTQPIDVLVQVSIDGDIHRGGAWHGLGRSGDLGADLRWAFDGSEPPGDRSDIGLDAVLAAVAADDALRLAGLMAVAPLDWSPDRSFSLLSEVAARVRVAYPTAAILSAGMSHDLENAVTSGATQVRIGSALLGARGGLR
jgi:uncharacterized pyridoxal phosphate-containing UPF0001 family protein